MSHILYEQICFVISVFFITTATFAQSTLPAEDADGSQPVVLGLLSNSSASTDTQVDRSCDAGYGRRIAGRRSGNPQHIQGYPKSAEQIGRSDPLSRRRTSGQRIRPTRLLRRKNAQLHRHHVRQHARSACADTDSYSFMQSGPLPLSQLASGCQLLNVPWPTLDKCRV